MARHNYVTVDYSDDDSEFSDEDTDGSDDNVRSSAVNCC
jgi:hypothetical protein